MTVTVTPTDRPPCACGACSPPGTRFHGATSNLAEAVDRFAESGPLALIGDERTLEACGHALASALGELGRDVRTVDLSADGAPHADERDARALAARLDGGVFPVAVGSGTINDLTKHAAFARERRYGCVATAASMNGYTSAVAALTVDGVKRTLPRRPPVFVFADPEVLAEAPFAMTRAGLADLLSKAVSSADWRLASEVAGDPYCPTPVRLAHDAVERAVSTADALETPAAAAALFEALVASGTSMTVAGHSAPASGAEHLISHFLDMTAACAPGGPRVPALHGEQVGVGTRRSAALWSRVVTLGAPGEVSETGAAAGDAWPEGPLPPAPADLDGHVRSIAPWLPDPLATSIADIGRGKLERLGPRASARRSDLRARWPSIAGEFADAVVEAARFVAVLDRVGAPRDAAGLGARTEEVDAGFRLGRYLRDRYTVLDLADDLVGLGAIV